MSEGNTEDHRPPEDNSEHHDVLDFFRANYPPAENQYALEGNGQAASNYHTMAIAKQLKRTKTAMDREKRIKTEKKKTGPSKIDLMQDPINEEEDNAFEGFSYKMMSDQENSH